MINKIDPKKQNKKTNQAKTGRTGLLTWLMSMRASQLSGCVDISPLEPITVESRPRSLIFWMVVPSTK